MEPTPADIAAEVRQVYLVPPDFSAAARSLLAASNALSDPIKTVALSFLDNLRGMMRTLSMPFEFTYTQVHGLHWQRIMIAERIRALGEQDDQARDAVARDKAKAKMQAFLSADGQQAVQSEVLERLRRLASDEQSLGTARELTRQGVVLMWSAFEVLSRDLFIILLNGNPGWTSRLLEQPATRKRFAVEKLDWQTLVAYSFDLSACMGLLLSQKADLDDIQTIRETYAALFPDAADMNRVLAEERLWFLFQKRNLIVHRRGLVDQHYLDRTGDHVPLGQQLCVTPAEIESLLAAVLAAGESLIRRAAL